MRNALLFIIGVVIILLIAFLLWWFVFRNKPPVAVDNAFTIQIDTVASGNLIIDDTDPENEPLALVTTPETNPASGTVQLAASGDFTYTPNAGFSGTDQFRYRVCDPRNACGEANVNIVITPFAVDDQFGTSRNTPVTGNLLLNDKGTNLVASSQAVSGLVLQPNGDFTFTPDLDFVGTINFTYEACDSASLCDSAEVSIEVATVDFELLQDNYTTRVNTAVSGNVTDNDTINDLSVNSTPAANPTNGSVTIEATGLFTYTPNIDFVGSDSFIYEVCDTLCLTAPVTILVSDDLVLTPDQLSTFINSPVTGNVLDNDIGDDLTVNLAASPATGPTNGTVEMQASGTTTYSPQSGFTGTDTFSYEACDNKGSCAQTTVTVEVTPPPPTMRHTVEQGDWLIQIARCYGTSVAVIRNANYLPYPDHLRPGQILTIPQVNSLGTFTGPPCVQRYFVKSGDTTASIAMQFGIKESDLRRINGILYPNGPFLRIGQLIVIPRPVPLDMKP